MVDETILQITNKKIIRTSPTRAIINAFFGGIFKLFMLLVQGLAFSFLAFVVINFALAMVAIVFDSLGISVTAFVGIKEAFSINDSIEEHASAPFIDALKACWKVPLCQASAAASAAVGASAVTYMQTRDAMRDETVKAVREAVNTCDESWNVKAFLQDLTDAMKGGNEAPAQYLTRARHLLKAWNDYKSAFEPLQKDYNGDFARLAVLLNGDSVSCDRKSEADGHINQEIWNILERISKTADCRRSLIVEGFRNLLDRVGVVELQPEPKRPEAPDTHTVATWAGLAFGFLVILGVTIGMLGSAH